MPTVSCCCCFFSGGGGGIYKQNLNLSKELSYDPFVTTILSWLKLSNVRELFKIYFSFRDYIHSLITQLMNRSLTGETDEKTR